jgi:hypothetical protein
MGLIPPEKSCNPCLTHKTLIGDIFADFKKTVLFSTTYS